jgi:outer membrane protein assembly factor BamB
VLLLAGGFAAGIWWIGTADEARLFALSAEDGRVRWSAALPAGTRAVGSPAVADGRVFVGSAGQEPLAGGPDLWRLTAFDGRTGRSLWEYHPPRERDRALEAVTMALTKPTLAPGHVLVRVEETEGASLLALTTESGQPAWTTSPIAFGHYSRHADVGVLDGRVLVPAPDGVSLKLRAVAERDGAEHWSVPLGIAGFGRNDLGPFFAASAETFYVGLWESVVALDASTGAERFRVHEPVEESGGQIAVADGLLLRRADLDRIMAYDARTGERRWTYNQPFADVGGILRSFAVGDGLLVASCACDGLREHDSGWLLAVDMASGVERWRVPIDAYFDLYQDIPAVGAGIVLTTSEQGDDVVARSAADGSLRWRFPRERGAWATVDGDLVYVTDRAPRWQHWLSRLNVR